MVTYEAVCSVCKKVKIYRQPIERRHITPECCGYKTLRKISPPMAQVIGKAAG